MANKHDSLLDFVKGKGQVSMDAKTFERQFKQKYGSDVKGWGRSINKNSTSGSSGYTKSLLKKHSDLRDVIQYDKNTDSYLLNGARPGGNNGGSKGPGIGDIADDVIDGIGNVLDSIPSPGDARSNLLGGLAMLLIIALISGGVYLYNAGKVFVGKANSFLSAEYNPEVFDYEGLEFIGNRRFNKPDGTCMRLDGGTDYTMGYFEGSELDGYGVVVRNDGSYLEIGTFKESQLTGYGIHRFGDSNYVGKFKKGETNGYGYCYNSDGTEYLVKFKDAAVGAGIFNSTEIIAQRSGDNWVKPNGKLLKVKDDTYKGITYLREGLILIDDVEYYFDPDGEAYYDGPEAQISWESDCCYYDSILEDNEGTRLTFYFDEGLQGQHQYNKGKQLMVNEFSVDMTLN